MITFKTLTHSLVAFRDERDWQQFHSLKNLIASVSIEASELLELTQWKNEEETEKLISDPKYKSRLGEECADILLYLLLVAEKANFDLASVANAKIDANRKKYPLEKARGNSKKYDEL